MIEFIYSLLIDNKDNNSTCPTGTIYLYATILNYTLIADPTGFMLGIWFIHHFILICLMEIMYWEKVFFFSIGDEGTPEVYYSV